MDQNQVCRSSDAPNAGGAGPTTKLFKPELPLLIVEDDPVQRRLAVSALTKFGWEIIEAETGAEGLTVIEERAPLVILTDLNTPNLSGIEMMRAVKHKKNIRAIVLTISDDPSAIIQALDANIIDYVIKPVKDWTHLHSLLIKAHASVDQVKKESQQISSLKEQADWQYWKALFLTGGQSNEMLRVLDMMHIQFNQDANYVHLLNMMRALKAEDDHVAVPKDLFDVVCGALAPIARFAEGIGIAQSVMHKTPTLSSYTMAEFTGVLDTIYNEIVQPIAKERGRTVNYWCDDVTRVSQGYAHIERELFETTVTELVINALKYSAQDDHVDINVQATPGENVNILITNPARKTSRGRDGELLDGVPRELEELAFRFFIRFSIDTQTNYNEQWPMGLGLPLARQVVTHFGGAISLHNENWHIGGGAGESPTSLVACRIELPIHEEGLAPVEEPSGDGLDDDNFEMF